MINNNKKNNNYFNTNTNNNNNNNFLEYIITKTEKLREIKSKDNSNDEAATDKRDNKYLKNR